MIPGKYQHVFRVVCLDESDVLIYCVCGSLIPLPSVALNIRRKYMYSSLQSVKIPGWPLPI
jgi:hypothetical protein